MVNNKTEAGGRASPPPPVRRRRGRGRPRGNSAGDVRERLLSAARELFLRYGYRAVSSRQIGAAAGVNFALIRYYFGGKPGLYREILKEVIPPQLAQLQELTGAQHVPRVQDLLNNIVRVWARNPWLAGFLLREVLLPDAPMRAMFSKEFPERLAPVLEQAVRSEIGAGTMREELDPKLLALSVVSLAVFPFLAAALTTRVFGVRHDEEFIERLLAHTQALLARGTTPGAGAR